MKVLGQIIQNVCYNSLLSNKLERWLPFQPNLSFAYIAGGAMTFERTTFTLLTVLMYPGLTFTTLHNLSSQPTYGAQQAGMFAQCKPFQPCIL